MGQVPNGTQSVPLVGDRADRYDEPGGLDAARPAAIVRSGVLMRRIIYCSQATDDVTPDALIALLEQSRHKNDQLRVTGLLLYSNQSFLQVLEGDNDAVADVYASITRDPRHTNLRLLLDAEIPARLFPDWTMGFEHVDDDELAENLEGFTPAIEYPLVNPKLISNAVVAATLLTLYAKNRTGRAPRH